MRVDLNADVGESFGAYSIGYDAEIIPIATSINIACGMHAGDPDIMAKTVELAVSAGTVIGAHPGFPDLLGFGRRNMDMKPAEVTNLVIYQVGALQAFVRAAGGKLQHVKPHGALYNMSAKDPEMAEAIALGVKKMDPNLILFGLAGSEHVKAAEKQGLRIAQEVFADRAYMPDGSLMPRSHPGAIIHDPDEAVRRVIQMVQLGQVESLGGIRTPVRADTVCLHGDHPAAVILARSLRQRLEEAGIQVMAIGR